MSMVPIFQSLGYDLPAAQRLQVRYRHVVKPFREEIKGRTVLDLASHDGRWPYMLARTGAAAVEGIEGRGELVAQFAHYPDDAAKRRVTLFVGDIFDHLARRVESGHKFDVVTCLGIFYHIMDHWRLLTMIQKLEPKLLIIDSLFTADDWPHIAVVTERTDKSMNAVSDKPAVPIGIPSMGALELMARALGWSVEHVDWSDVGPRLRRTVPEYFGRKKNRLRRTCALRPVARPAGQLDAAAVGELGEIHAAPRA